MKYAPKKVFIIENGKYIELTYEEYILRKENNDTVKFFLPLYGVLMEVSEDTYKEYYQDLQEIPLTAYTIRDYSKNLE